MGAQLSRRNSKARTRTAVRPMRSTACRWVQGTTPQPIGRLLATTALTGCLVLFAAGAMGQSLPTGGTVVGGSATITQTSASRLDIRQSTDRAVINWNSFSIGAGNTVNIQQPGAGSISVQQVVGQNPSQIFGTLSSNGQVVIANPNGIWFGPSSHVDVAGVAASASTMSQASAQSFVAGGRLTFDTPGKATASVVNDGTITVADAGVAAFVAPGVANNGVIQARLGKVQLASGNTYTLDMNGDGLVQLAVSDKVLQQALGPDGKPLTSGVSNAGKILADGGAVYLTANVAKNVVDNVIDMSGVVQAQGVQMAGGDIVLTGGDGAVAVSGTLDASGQMAGQTGGTVKVLGSQVALNAGAKIDVSGDTGGGTALVGGNFHGAGPEQNAQTTYVDTSAGIKADAITSGNGGKVAVWADGTTVFNGNITARGGSISGDGGFVETSGHRNLIMTGRVDTRAPHGTDGTLLLDPTDVTITDPDTTFNEDCLTDPTKCSPTGASARIYVTDLNNYLDNNNVEILTSGNNGQSGTITVDGTGIAVDSGHSLKLTADSDIIVNANNQITSSNLGGSITLSAQGGITLGNNATISSNAAGSNIALSAVGAISVVGTLSSSNTGNISVTTTGAGNGISVTGSILSSDGGKIDVTSKGTASITGLITGTAAGNITVAADSDITIGAAGRIRNTNGSGNITLSTGGAFINSRGATALSVVSGRWLIYTQDPNNDSINGLTYNFRQWGTDYPTAPTPAAGSGFLYHRAAPLSTSLQGTVTKTYDATTTAGVTSANFTTLTGWFAGEGPNGGSGGSIDVSSASANFASKDVGNWNVTVTGLKTTAVKDSAGHDVYGYTVSDPAAASIGSISAKALTVGGITASNKTYDATTAASLNLAGAALQAAEAAGTGTTSDGKPYSGDTVSVDTSGASGTFTDKNAANGITVNISGLTLAGAQNGNYTLTAPTTTANITAKALTVSGITASNKTYDATTAASLNLAGAALQAAEAAGTGAANDGKPYSGDTVTLDVSGASGTFTDKNAANGITVNISGLVLAGAQNGNYALTAPTTTANITAKALTVSGITASNKTYDATTTASLNLAGAALQAAEAAGTGAANDGKPYSGDTVSVDTSGASGTFTDKNAANGITVNISSLALAGAQNGNYTVTAPTTTANITAKALTVSGITASNKTYDATTAASLNLAGAALQAAEAAGTGAANDGKPYSGDTVTLDVSGASGTFTDKNAANGITVNISGLVLAGAQNGNYALTAPTTTANITAKALTVSGITASNKTYDATTTASLNLAGAALQAAEAAGAGAANDGKPYSGDTVSLDTGAASGTFVSKNAASGITVNISGLALAGAQNGNYTLTAPTTTANIAAKALTVGGITASNKTYDATTTASLNLAGAALQAAEAAGTGTANDGKPYSGDTVSVDTSGASGTFTDKNAANGITVNISSLALAGAQNGNYTLTAPTTTANITAKALTVSGITASNKTYDATTAASLNLAGAALQAAEAAGTGAANDGKPYSGDTVTLDASGASGTFTDKNAANGITVNISSLALAGAQNGNYTLTAPTTTANITAKALTVSGITASNKTYDATTTASLNLAGAALQAAEAAGTGTANDGKPYSGDTVSLNTGAAGGTFVSKNAASGITVNVSALALAGAQNGNYTVTAPTTTADIAAKALTIAAPSGTSLSKAYDGTTTYAGSITVGALSGFVGLETVTVGSASGVYNSKDVASASQINVSYTLSDGTNGGLASNYSLPSGTIGGASIASKGLTITANDTTKTAGDPLPTFTASYGGFVSGETSSLVSGLRLATTATASSPAGTYAITPSGATAANYVITYVGGTLTVNASPSNNDAVSAQLTAQQPAGTTATPAPMLSPPLGVGLGALPAAGGEVGGVSGVIVISSSDEYHADEITHAFSNAYIDGSEPLPPSPSPASPNGSGGVTCVRSPLMIYQECVRAH
jgi:filamentous hemagglutinin family protein